MSEEKKGFSFFRLLIILWIIAGLGGTALFLTHKDSKQDWISYFKENIFSLKSNSSVIIPVQTKKAQPVVQTPAPIVLPVEIQKDVKGMNELDETTFNEQVEEIFENENKTNSETQPPEEIPDEIIEAILEDQNPITEEKIKEEDFLVQTTLPDNVFQPSEEKSEEVVSDQQQEVVESLPLQNEEETQPVQEAQDIVLSDSENVKEEAPIPVIQKRFTTTYSWKDFQEGKPCASKEVFDDDHKEISNILYSYCKAPEVDAWQKWEATFREGKRTYFVQKTLKEKTKYIKYLKVLPHLLFDIHKNNTNGNTLMDQLDKIETLINKRQTEKAVELLQKITDEEARLALNPALMEGNHLLAIQKFLNNHSEGGNND